MIRMLKVMAFFTPLAIPSVFFISDLLGNCLGRGIYSVRPPYNSSKVSLEKKVFFLRLIPSLSGAPAPFFETFRGLEKSILNFNPSSVNSVHSHLNPVSLSFLSVPFFSSVYWSPPVSAGASPLPPSDGS
jgi:hypothetical protein